MHDLGRQPFGRYLLEQYEQTVRGYCDNLAAVPSPRARAWQQYEPPVDILAGSGVELERLPYILKLGAFLLQQPQIQFGVRRFWRNLLQVRVDGAHVLRMPANDRDPYQVLALSGAAIVQYPDSVEAQARRLLTLQDPVHVSLQLIHQTRRGVAHTSYIASMRAGQGFSCKDEANLAERQSLAMTMLEEATTELALEQGLADGGGDALLG